jgi:hypothetical protein
MGKPREKLNKHVAIGFLFGLMGSFVSVQAVAEDVFVAGPIEKIDAAKREAVVLGQTVRLDRRQFARFQNLARSQGGSGYRAYVEVAGTSASDGSILGVRIQGGQPYVAGSSAIAVRNFVTKAVNSNGYLTIGDLRVDASAVSEGVQAGDLVEVAGIQPSSSGVAIATIFSRVRGVIGSGTSGVIGSGANGVIGSGTSGVIGSGTSGVIGSGANGVIGSGTSGVIGSGTSGVIGSGANGVIGSGTK